MYLAAYVIAHIDLNYTVVNSGISYQLLLQLIGPISPSCRNTGTGNRRILPYSETGFRAPAPCLACCLFKWITTYHRLDRLKGNWIGGINVSIDFVYVGWFLTITIRAVYTACVHTRVADPITGFRFAIGRKLYTEFFFGFLFSPYDLL